MPNRTIPELTAAGALAGTDVVHIVDGAGNSRKMTLAALKTFINTDPTVVPSSVAWRGARVYRTSDLTGVSSAAIIPWQAESIDTDSIWSAGAPTRLTVPTGVTKVRLWWGINHESLGTAGSVFSRANKNGFSPVNGDGQFNATSRQTSTGFSDNRSGGFTSTLSVTAGDYFEVQIYLSMTGQDQVLAAYGTWFEMEIVEATI